MNTYGHKQLWSWLAKSSYGHKVRTDVSLGLVCHTCVVSTCIEMHLPVCLCLYISIHMSKCTSLYTCLCTRPCTPLRTDVSTHVFAHACTQCSCLHTSLRWCLHTCVCAGLYTCRCTCAYAHVYTHAYAHVSTHVCTRMHATCLYPISISSGGRRHRQGHCGISASIIVVISSHGYK